MNLEIVQKRRNMINSHSEGNMINSVFDISFRCPLDIQVKMLGEQIYAFT